MAGVSKLLVLSALLLGCVSAMSLRTNPHQNFDQAERQFRNLKTGMAENKGDIKDFIGKVNTAGVTQAKTVVVQAEQDVTTFSKTVQSKINKALNFATPVVQGFSAQAGPNGEKCTPAETVLPVLNEGTNELTGIVSKVPEVGMHLSLLVTGAKDNDVSIEAFVNSLNDVEKKYATIETSAIQAATVWKSTKGTSDSPKKTLEAAAASLTTLIESAKKVITSADALVGTLAKIQPVLDSLAPSAVTKVTEFKNTIGKFQGGLAKANGIATRYNPDQRCPKLKKADADLEPAEKEAEELVADVSELSTKVTGLRDAIGSYASPMETATAQVKTSAKGIVGQLEETLGQVNELKSLM